MRPTPRKLALLMSLAGLGLSLGEAAHAKSEPTSRVGPVAALGLSSLADGGEDAPVFPEAEAFAVPAGPLDITLPIAEAATTPSEEDRAAIALAMVLMAEPFLPAPAPAMAMPVAPASSAWEYSDAFLRDFDDAPAIEAADGQGASAVAMERGHAADRFHDRDSSHAPGDADDDAASVFAELAGAPTPIVAVDLDLGAASNVDLPLAIEAANSVDLPLVIEAANSVDLPLVIEAANSVDLPLDIALAASVDLPLHAPPAPSIDLNLDLAAGLDLNLDLASGLDLNLDLGTGIDLRLDRPPVFAVSTLRPIDKSSPLVSTAPRVQPVEISAANEPEAAANPAPTIVVATHSERVLHSLEALLSNDPAEGRFGARPQEVYVTSHAERALLMLAAACEGGTEHADIEFDVDPHAAAAAPAPIAASARKAAPKAADCKPGTPGVQTARPARRSPMGDNVVAMSERGLDRVRGGFQTSNGLQISFGIERAVYINGSLVTTTSLNFSDAGKMSSAQSQTAGASAATAAAPGSMTLIQNGAGNTFVTGPVSASNLGTVVQNTLNDQKIQSVTSINAMVNSLQVVKQQNFQSSLRGAIIDSLRR